jgi:uncharacterized membrane protein HdeD (DUF308 family)
MVSFVPGMAGLKEFVDSWSWFLALGILTIILGILAIGSSMTATSFSLIFIGWLLIIAAALVGLLYVVVGFKVQMGRAFPASSLVVGFMLVADPGARTLTKALLITIFFLISGTFRITASLAMRFPQWGWVLFNGIVALVLGILVLLQWPAPGFRIMGHFIGLDFILSGWSWVMLSWAARRLGETVSLDGPSVASNLIQKK